jgi:hypothetical protein
MTGGHFGGNMGGMSHFGGMSRVGGMSQFGGMSRLGGMNHAAGMNHAMNHLGGAPQMGGMNRMGRQNSFTAARGAQAEQRAAPHAGAPHAATTTGSRTDAAKSPRGNESRLSTAREARSFNREDRVHDVNRDGRVYERSHRIPYLLTFDTPVLSDDVPQLPGRPVLADGGNRVPSGGIVEVNDPNDTPSEIVKVDRPCAGAKLKVTSARSECVNGVVHITGDEFYYCPAKNRFEVRHYDYTPVPNIKCDGTRPGPQYPLPPGWTTVDDPNAGRCQRKQTPQYVSQWVAGPQYWELQTWEVYECTDANGQTIDRLFRTPDVSNGGRIPSSDPVPVTPESLRGPI